MTDVLIKRELLERLLYSSSPERFDATEYNAARAELFAILANPTQQGEAVEVVAWRWKYQIPKEIAGSEWDWSFASHWSTGPKDAEPLMTVAQHQRIMAASVPAGCEVVPVELLERVATHLEWDGSEPMTTIQYAYKCDGLAAKLRALLTSAEGGE